MESATLYGRRRGDFYSASPASVAFHVATQTRGRAPIFTEFLPSFPFFSQPIGRDLHFNQLEEIRADTFANVPSLERL